MRYLKTYAISAPLFAILYHWIAIEPMPWWPDAVIMGAFMGAMAAFVVMRLTFAGRALRHFGNAVSGAARVAWQLGRRD